MNTINDELYFTGELINLETDLFEKTKFLYNDLIENSDKNINLVQFRLSEIFTLKQTLDLYLKIKFELQSYEITSLLSFWDDTFHEMKEVVADNDSNTSWMYSRFDNFKGQHEIVDSMLRTHYNSLKESL